MNPQNSFFRALAHRNFRLFLAGQAISLIGTWTQQVALTWYVWELTRDPLWLGVINFTDQIPAFFLAPVAGAVVERVNRHRLLLLTQALAMVQALLLAVLTLAGTRGMWQLGPLLALSLGLGVVNAFDMTARQTFLIEMVPRREDLSNAIALNSSMVNGTRLIGPALASLLLAATNAGICFLVNGLSYLAVLAALLAMHVPPRPAAAARGHLTEELLGGFRYAFGFRPIRAILLLLALVSLFAMSFTVLLPLFATELKAGMPVLSFVTSLGGEGELQKDPQAAMTYGVLLAARAVGALIGAVFLASRKSVRGLGKWIALCPAAFGVALLGFSLSTVLWASLLLSVVIGFSMMVQMAASNTILQTIVEEDKRARVMSFYTMAFLGMAPLGALLGGILAKSIGASHTIQVAGICCVVGSLLFTLQLPALRAAMRPIYRRMGILPEVASGLHAATEMSVPPEHE